jgi:hypothetical protein
MASYSNDLESLRHDLEALCAVAKGIKKRTAFFNFEAGEDVSVAAGMLRNAIAGITQEEVIKMAAEADLQRK